MAFIRQHINFCFLFVLPVYLYIVQTSIQNKHTHVDANGIAISHSHPFDKDKESTGTQHEHTKQEICLYSTFTFDVYDLPEVTGLAIQVNETEHNYAPVNERYRSALHLLNTIPRGPPTDYFFSPLHLI